GWTEAALQSLPVIVQPLAPQVHDRLLMVREPPGLNVSVSERPNTEPQPVFVTVPDMSYVTVPADMLAVAFPHDLFTLIAQVLKLPSIIDFIEAVVGLLPEVTLANKTLLKHGAVPPKNWLRSIAPS